MGSEQNKELVHRLVNEAVNQKNLKALDEVAEGEIAQAALALSITTTAGLVSKHFRTTSELASDGGWIEVVRLTRNSSG